MSARLFAFLFLLFRHDVDGFTKDLFHSFADAFVVSWMRANGFRHFFGGHAIGDGDAHFADHIGGAGAHHLCPDDLVIVCAGDDFDETAVFLGDQALAVAAHDVLTNDDIETGGLCFVFGDADGGDLRIGVDAGWNDGKIDGWFVTGEIFCSDDA